MPENETGPAMVAVRLTMWPDKDTLVPPDEVPVLRHQGLVIEDEKPADSAPAPVQPPAKPAGIPAATPKAGA